MGNKRLQFNRNTIVLVKVGIENVFVVVVVVAAVVVVDGEVKVKAVPVRSWIFLRVASAGFCMPPFGNGSYCTPLPSAWLSI